MVNEGSFVKHTIGETLEPGWLVKIKRPGCFTVSEVGYIDDKLGCDYMGIVLEQVGSKEHLGEREIHSECWRILLPNGKKPIVKPDEVELMAG